MAEISANQETKHSKAVRTPCPRSDPRSSFQVSPSTTFEKYLDSRVGRKSKPSVTISPVAGGTEVPPADQLPPFRRFLDIDGKQRGKKLLTRLFFVTPNEHEISATEKEHESKTDTQMYVIAARMPWMGGGVVVNTPLFDYCQSVGFAEDFAEDIVRLVINRINGRHLGRNSLYQTESGMREFVRFLSTRNPRPRSITDLDKDTHRNHGLQVGGCEVG